MRSLLFLLSGPLVWGSLFADVAPVPGTQRVAPVFEGAALVCNCFVESLKITDEQRLQRAGKPLVRQLVVAKIEVKESYNKEFQGGADT